MASRILAGRYELLEKIGEGGMAVVFKSRDRLLNRFVAIKILRPEFTKDPVFIESFRRESQMAAGLSHPNIVNIFDVGKEGNIYYIVMELMEGAPLSEIIKKEGPLEPHRAANITRQIAMGLSAAHKNNLIHRDVKPHNIMFAGDGSAKITDFGIAKKVTGETLVTNETKKENVMGSVHYFSPEQARGAYVDAKSDIYSLGVCLYEMLTGKVPFDGETAVEVAVKHMNEKMVPPTQLKSDIPQDLEDIVMKATDKNPSKRFQNMDEMITALNFASYAKHKVESTAEEEFEELTGVAAVPSSDDFLINKEAGIEEAPAPKRNEIRFGEYRGSSKKKHIKFDIPKDEIEEVDEFPFDRKARVHAEQAKETETEKKKFFLSPQRYIAVILAIALAIPLSSAIFKLANKAQEEKPIEIVEVTVPSVINKTVDQATKELKKLGLKLEVDLELVSKDVDAGIIMSQTPKDGSVVKSDQTVRVNVSKGYTQADVPNVSGKSEKNAKTVLESYGYKVVVAGYQNSDTMAQGCVISQNPKAGTALDQGQTVSITISAGVAQTDTFDIVGKTYSEALEIINAADYSVGVRTNQASSEVEDGCIIKYAVNGKKVDLWVSSGRGGSGSGETQIDGYIQYFFNYEGVEFESDAFTVKMMIVDDNGSRTINDTCIVENKNKTLYIGGSGSDAEVTIMAENQLIAQLTHVNFATGVYDCEGL